MDKFKAGDKVKVKEISGKVVPFSPSSGFVSIVDGVTGLAHMFKESQVEKREPEYKPNTMYVDAKDRYFLRHAENEWDDDVWQDTDGDFYRDNEPTRPLRILVPQEIS